MGNRLQALDQAEKHYFDLQKNLLQGEFDRLNRGEGEEEFYSQYKNAPQDQQQALVDEYVANRIKGNRDLEAALEQYKDKAKIVPVALDYGSVLLRRAETMGPSAGGCSCCIRWCAPRASARPWHGRRTSWDDKRESPQGSGAVPAPASNDAPEDPLAG